MVNAEIDMNDFNDACYQIIKRAFDILFSAGVIALSILPGAALSAVIAIQSRGYPFYTQERVGKGGKLFQLYKFRSMVADADCVEKYLSPEQLKQWDLERKVDDDPRITVVGQFMRKTSIDELPQFINVLKGDMSIIGPRAITKHELDMWFTEAQKKALLSVPQGITGWWQVQRRNEATFESGERQELELWYVQHASLPVDLRIFVGTFSTMFGNSQSGR